jgi:hypothetical protein
MLTQLKPALLLCVSGVVAAGKTDANQGTSTLLLSRFTLLLSRFMLPCDSRATYSNFLLCLQHVPQQS